MTNYAMIKAVLIEVRAGAPIGAAYGLAARRLGADRVQVVEAFCAATMRRISRKWGVCA